MKVHNQKTIRFNCPSTLTKGDDEIIFSSARDLDAGAFKLYMYLYKEGMRYGCYDLSSKRCCEDFGIKRAQYNSAVAELIKKGYLVRCIEIDSVINLWDFYLMPVVKID